MAKPEQDNRDIFEKALDYVIPIGATVAGAAIGKKIGKIYSKGSPASKRLIREADVGRAYSLEQDKIWNGISKKQQILEDEYHNPSTSEQRKAQIRDEWNELEGRRRNAVDEGNNGRADNVYNRMEVLDRSVRAQGAGILGGGVVGSAAGNEVNRKRRK